MRLLKEIPEVEIQIKEGSLNLTHLTKCQQFLRNERAIEHRTYTREEKLDLVMSLQNTSQRELEKTLAELSPGACAHYRRRRTEL